MLTMCRQNISRGERHAHLAVMLRRLAIYSVDQFKRAMRILPAVDLWLDPDGKEHGPHVTVFGRRKVEMPAIQRLGEIVALIEQPLGSVGVSIDDQCVTVHHFVWNQNFTMRSMSTNCSSLRKSGNHVPPLLPQPLMIGEGVPSMQAYSVGKPLFVPTGLPRNAGGVMPP